MRIVDVNALLPGSATTLEADERWAIESRERWADGAGEAPADRPSPGGLRRQLVVLPGPIGPLEQRLSRYLDAGAPALVRICPGLERHGYPLAAWSVGVVPEVCRREGLALAVDSSAMGGYPWVDLVSFARRYPGLPCVAIAAPLDDHTAAAALDATPNLILETSAVTDAATLGTLTSLVNGHGAHRFVYGSGERAQDAPPPWQDLPDEAAMALASGTAELLDARAWADTYL